MIPIEIEMKNRITTAVSSESICPYFIVFTLLSLSLFTTYNNYNTVDNSVILSAFYTISMLKTTF
jgi:hypothetical protein